MLPYGEYLVTNVDETYSTHGTELWRVTSLRPDNVLHCHVFPKTTMQSRAAEYGIDPTDTNTLLDIVLHEPYMVSPLDHFYDEDEDPVVKAGLMGTAKTVIHNLRTGKTIRPGEPMAAWCYNCCEETARQAHLMRLDHCKKNRVHVLDTSSKLAIIRKDSPILSREVAEMRGKINAIRNKTDINDVSPIPVTRGNIERVRPERIPRNGRVI